MFVPIIILPSFISFKYVIGIGRAIVQRLAQNGATVYALSKSAQHLESLAKEEPGVKTVNVDLEDWDATRKVVEAIARIDLLVNNAGVNVLESFLDIQQDSFDKYVYIDLIFFLVC